MSIRLTIDHKFTIVDAEAVTDKSPYSMCGDIAPAFRKLIGLRIGGGFHRAVREWLGGAWLHAHRRAKLGPVATTAFQTVSSKKARDLNNAHREKTGTGPPKDPNAPPKLRRKPYMLDTCHTWASDSEVTKRWVPHFYTGPDAEAVHAAVEGKDVEMEG